MHFLDHLKECNDKELRQIEANKIIKRMVQEEMQNLITTQRNNLNKPERAKMAKEVRARLKDIIDSATKEADRTICNYGLG